MVLRASLLSSITAALALATSAVPALGCAKVTSWVSGSSEICSGAIVYHDYVDDDFGADDGRVHNTDRTAGLAPSAGDQQYPAGEEATADLIRLTLEPEGDSTLKLTAELNALFRPGSTVVAVAIDTDNDPATGGGTWGALNVSSRGWDQIAFFDTGDPDTNLISGTLTMPTTPRWRVQAVAAQKATGTVMNVAFRGVDERARFGTTATGGSDVGSWFEDDQAAALRAGDISRFGFEVDRADVLGGVTRRQQVGPGLHERVYTSAYTVGQGEGISIDGVPGRGNGGGSGPSLGFEQRFQYLGRYQPYGIYIPHRTPGANGWGMQLAFHGSSSVMSGLVNQPGMQQRFGEDLGRVIVVPEGRGAEGWGSDVSERDLLDVIADVKANYAIDADRVFAGGYSQGGYVTYRMASLHPDLFAGSINWVGFTGDGSNGAPAPGFSYTAGAIGNAPDFISNMRHIPSALLYAAGDELVHAWTALAMNDAFKRTDNTYAWFMHPAAEHMTFAVLDDWRKEAAYTAGLTRVSNPPRVTFRTAAFLDSPAHGIVHDRAYWLSAIRERTPGYADSDLTTHACGGSTPLKVTRTRNGLDPLPWYSEERAVAGSTPLVRLNKLTGSLRNVASLTIDAQRACLAGKSFAYDLTTDGATAVSFSDGRSLTLPGAGRHQGTLAP